MSTDLETIRNYFAPPSQSFWTWHDDGRAIAWKDGVTIAFREELREVLLRLTPTGLPPLDAVLLVLAACRESWGKSPSRAGLLQGLLASLHGEAYRGHLAAILEGLNKVHDLRRRLQTTAARAELLAMVFDTLPARKRSTEGRGLLEAFHAGLTEHEQHRPDGAKDDSGPRLRAALGCLLSSRLTAVDEDSLALRLQTGLEELPAPAEIEPPPATTARDMISQLQDDEELGGVARLARLLLAVVQLPRAVSDPEELPLGGVSDIANRGSLDRLLLSELAHDDLTLAVRVALNEALYLRREAPPRTPPRERLVLLDAGIRLWGVPRVFAAAVGLALAAASKKNLQVTAFRAQGSDLEPVDFSTKAGLAAHLGALDHRAHPGEALARFAALAQERHGPGDLVVVTGEDVADDPAFQQAVARAEFGYWHLATVSRSGQFRLEHRGPRGSKLLEEATLALDAVLKPRPRSAALIDQQKAEPLPAVCRMEPFPLRLSTVVEPSRSWHVHGHGVLTLTGDGRLLYWDDPAHGAAQLTEGLPAGRLHWASPTADADGFATAVIGRLSRDGLYVLRTNLRNGKCNLHRLELAADSPVAVAGRKGLTYVMFSDHLSALDSLTGRCLATGPIAGWRSLFHTVRHGGALRPDPWLVICLAYNGGRITTFALPWYGELAGPVRAFEVVGIEGPVAIGESGEICLIGQEKRVAVHHGLPTLVEVLAVSRDGQHVALKKPVPSHQSQRSSLARQPLVVVDVLTGTTREVNDTPTNAVEWRLRQYARPRLLRHRFQGITLDGERRLTLITRSGGAWPIAYDRQRNAIVLARHPAARRAADWLSFKYDGYSLHVARWEDGSRAVLDARGLLHLQSSDPNPPEFSLVLAEGEMAGWASDGRWWGPEYFCHPHPRMPAKDVYGEYFVPFLARLP